MLSEEWRPFCIDLNVLIQTGVNRPNANTVLITFTLLVRFQGPLLLTGINFNHIMDI